MKIIAIDFETANQHPESACAIGFSVYEQGRVFSDAYLVKPPKGYDDFHYYNVKVHGITKNLVENAPDFAWVMNQIKPYFEQAYVIAHNAPFDLKVLKGLCLYYGIELPPFRYLDTVTLSRKLFPTLTSHSLSVVAHELQLPLQHHNAKSDAIACLEIYLYALAHYGSHENIWHHVKLKEFSLL